MIQRYWCSAGLSRRRWRGGLTALLSGTLVLGCGGPSAGGQGAESAIPAVPVTLGQATLAAVEETERSLGELVAPSAPAVAAETPGVVVAIFKDAGDRVRAGEPLAELDDEVQHIELDAATAVVARLQALLDTQQRTVARLEPLVRDQAASENLLDDAEAQQRALAAQLREADARLRQARRNLEKTLLRSPLDGVIRAKRISVGDFVSSGQPAFDVVRSDLLRAYLPYPEVLQTRLRPGLPVRLWRPGHGGDVVSAAVSELRPVVGTMSRAVDVIVEFDNPGGWLPGGNVVGEVVVARRDSSVTVSEASVVQRPSGLVVYVAADGRAIERPVQTGRGQQGRIEILTGLDAGETVVVDGAGFLADGASIVERPGEAP
ncbi:MAG: efflux RND transporter periplasmic adaptor subunit [Pseudomonadales bacterium]